MRYLYASGNLSECEQVRCTKLQGALALYCFVPQGRARLEKSQQNHLSSSLQGSEIGTRLAAASRHPYLFLGFAVFSTRLIPHRRAGNAVTNLDRVRPRPVELRQVGAQPGEHVA
jgi:hypothetical protein